MALPLAMPSSFYTSYRTLLVLLIGSISSPISSAQTKDSQETDSAPFIASVQLHRTATYTRDLKLGALHGSGANEVYAALLD